MHYIEIRSRAANSHNKLQLQMVSCEMMNFRYDDGMYKFKKILTDTTEFVTWHGNNTFIKSNGTPFLLGVSWKFSRKPETCWIETEEGSKHLLWGSLIFTKLMQSSKSFWSKSKEKPLFERLQTSSYRRHR